MWVEGEDGRTDGRTEGRREGDVFKFSRLRVDVLSLSLHLHSEWLMFERKGGGLLNTLLPILPLSLLARP